MHLPIEVAGVVGEVEVVEVANLHGEDTLPLPIKRDLLKYIQVSFKPDFGLFRLPDTSIY